MANTPKINFSSIEFDVLKQELIDYITATSEFTDHNTEGSNFNLFTGLLAYVTNILSFNLNQGINENYLSTTELRDSALKIIKMLNYNPYRAQSSGITVDLSSVVATASPKNLLIYDKLSGGGYTWYYTGTGSTSLDANEVTGTTLTEVLFRAGVLVSNESGYTGTDADLQSFVIQDTDMGDFLRIFTISGGVRTYWEEFDPATLYATPQTERIFFIKEISTGYEISFGNGNTTTSIGLGFKPAVAEVIGFEYIQPADTESNNVNTFTWVGGGGGENINSAYADGTITTTTIALNSSNASSFGGGIKESIEEIKFNSPRFHTSQGRATNENDYEAITLKHPYVLNVVAVGGEKSNPPQLGKVFLTIKGDAAKTGDINLTDSQLTEVFDFIDPLTVVSITPVLSNPQFIYMQLTSVLRHKTDTSPVISSIVSSVDTFINTANGDFGDYLEFSKLVANVDSADDNITSSINTLETYALLKETNIDNEDSIGNKVENGDYAVQLPKNLLSTYTTRIEEYDTIATGTPLLNTYTENTHYTLSYTDTVAGADGNVTISFSSGDLGIQTTGNGSNEYRLFFDTVDDDIILNQGQIMTLDDTDYIDRITTEKISI